MRRRYAAYWIAVLLTLGAPSYAGTITTAGITAKTSAGALACMRWMPIGLCFWLDCGFSGCDVEVSLKVGHYNPDLVLSAYNELGGNPSLEIRSALGLAQRAAAGGLLGTLLGVAIESAGNRTEATSDARDHTNLLFRETDAIGPPVGSLSRLVGRIGLICRSQAVPFFPYFQSGLDAFAWRTEIREIFYPAGLIPGLREIGTWPVQSWGSVHPRTGWVTQAEEPKAAAVNVQRAGDIVTRIAQPHIYAPLSGPITSAQKVWPPGPLRENDHRTGTCQMLVPKTDSSCAGFGTNDLASSSGWAGGRVDESGDYAWNLWRPYKCCRRVGQWFLFDIDWTRYPP